MLNIPPAAVERGAKALYDHEWHADRGTESVGDKMPEWPELPDWLAAAAYRTQASSVLTAALRLDDPETVERVAKAIWDDGRLNDSNAPFDQPWRGMGKSMKEHYRRLARAAISALLGAEDE